MTERVFVLLVVVGAGLAALIAIDCLLSLFFDDQMRRRRSPSATPGRSPVNGTARGEPRGPSSKRNEPWGGR